MDGDLLEGRSPFRDAVAQGGPHRRVRDLEEKLSGFDPGIFDAARAQFAKKQRDPTRPSARSIAWRLRRKRRLKTAFRGERKYSTSACGPIVDARATSLRGARGQQDSDAEGYAGAAGPSAAVIGAGTMGGGIAMNFANA